MDTRSDVSVYLYNQTVRKKAAEAYKLYAANRTAITIYRTCMIQPDLELRRAFLRRERHFVIVDTTQPIIGAELLAYYHVLPDIKEIDRWENQTIR